MPTIPMSQVFYYVFSMFFRSFLWFDITSFDELVTSTFFRSFLWLGITENSASFLFLFYG